MFKSYFWNYIFLMHICYLILFERKGRYGIMICLSVCSFASLLTAEVNKWLSMLAGSRIYLPILRDDKMWHKVSVTWYATERGKGRSIPLPFSVWINRPQDWPLKGIYERKSIPRTPWPAACWTKNGIQVTRVSWPDSMGGEGKS